MSVPFSQLTAKLKVRPEEEIILLYGLLGNFRQPQFVNKDSKVLVADFVNYTRGFSVPGQEFPLGTIPAHEIGRGGYEAIVITRWDKQKTGFWPVAVLNRRSSDYRVEPNMRLSFKPGCILSVILFLIFSAAAAYTSQDTTTPLCLVLAIAALVSLVCCPFMGIGEAQKKYKREAESVCRALITGDTWKNLNERYDALRSQYETNEVQNLEDQGFPDIDLDS